MNRKNIYFITIFIILFSILTNNQKVSTCNSLSKKIICFYLEKKLNSKVHFNTISFSFFGKQKITNFEIQNQHYTFISKIISIDQSIFSLLTHFYIKNITIENFYFKIKNEQQKNILEKFNNKGEFSFISKMEEIKLNNGMINLQNTDHLKENSFQEVFFSKTQDKILSSGKIYNPNNQGHFFIDISIQPLMSVSINILNFPLDIFFNFDLDTEKADHFNLQEYVNITFSTHNNVLQGNIQSKNIEGFIQGKIKDNSILFKEKNSFLVLKNKFLIYFLNKKFNKKISIDEEYLNIFTYIKEGVFNFKDIKSSTFNIISEIKSLKFSTKNDKSFYIKNLNIKNIKTKFSPLSSLLEGIICYENTNSYFNISITNLISIEEQKNIFINDLSIPESLINEFFTLPIKEITLSMNIINITGKLYLLEKILSGNISLKANNLSAKVFISHKLTNYKITLSGFYIPSEKFFTYICNVPKINFDINGDLEQDNLYFSNFFGKLYSNNFFINIKAKISSSNKLVKIKDIILSLQGKLDGVLFQFNSFPTLNIDNGYFDLCFNGKNNHLTGSSLLNINAIDFNKKSSTFLLSLEKILINNLFSNGIINYHNFQSSFYGKIKNLSIELLEHIDLIPFPVSSIIEKNSLINFSGDIDEKSEHFFSLKSQITTSNLNISNQWNFNKSFEITPSSKSCIELIITPKDYKKIINELSIQPDCLLDSDITLTAEIHPINNFYKKQIEGFLFSKSLTFKSNSTQETIYFSDINGEIKASLEENFLEYKIKGSKDENSFIKIKGSIKKPSLNTSFYQGKATLKYLPSFFSLGILPIPLSLKESFEQLSGKIITQLFEWDLKNHQGTLSCNFDSPNIQAKIPLEIHNKFITLFDTAELHLFLNKSFIDVIMKDFSFFTIKENIHLPISLFIEKSNVFIPIHPYEFKDIIISSAYLDLGQIQIIKNDKIKQLFDFLKIQDQNSFMKAWFTPIYFNLKNGILFYKRFDLLINKMLHLAFWGKTNLLNNHLNTTLGIEPFTLEKILKINNLPKNNFFLVKIQGPIDNPSIDWSSAYSRLGILSAASSGGHLGNLFGNVLDKFLSALGGQTPPPTTKPFPWEEK